MFIKYSAIFLILTIALVFSTVISWNSIGPASAVFCYPAVAFGALAIAYGGAGPRVFMKRADGRTKPLGRMILAPYRWLNVLSFRLYRRACKEPAYVQVLPNLFFGRRLTRPEATEAIAAEGWIGALRSGLRIRRGRAVADLAARIDLSPSSTRPRRARKNYERSPIGRSRRCARPSLCSLALGHGRSADGGRRDHAHQRQGENHRRRSRPTSHAPVRRRLERDSKAGGGMPCRGKIM